MSVSIITPKMMCRFHWKFLPVGSID